MQTKSVIRVDFTNTLQMMSGGPMPLPLVIIGKGQAAAVIGMTLPSSAGRIAKNRSASFGRTSSL